MPANTLTHRVEKRSIRRLPSVDRAAALAVVLALSGVAALIANPLFGALSDRTRGRFGRQLTGTSRTAPRDSSAGAAAR